MYEHPEQLSPHVADKRNLAPMYSKLHQAIRQVDDSHIIFFEPSGTRTAAQFVEALIFFAFASLVIVTQVPLVHFAETGLEQGPGGPAYNDRQVDKE